MKGNLLNSLRLIQSTPTRTFSAAFAVFLVCAIIAGCTKKENPQTHKTTNTAPQNQAATPDMPKTLAGLQLDVEHGPQRFDKENLWEHMNGGAHEIIRLGFQQLVVAYYQDPGGANEVRVQAFFMASPDAAESLFRAWNSRHAAAGDICGRSMAENGTLSWLNGPLYVQFAVTGGGEPAASLLERMGRELCAELAHAQANDRQ